MTTKTTSLLILCITLSLPACTGHMTLTQQDNITTSKTIFMAPTAEKTIFVEVRNSSDNPHLEFKQLIPSLKDKGYTIDPNPETAHFILQTNTVFCNKAKEGQTLDTIIGAGWGGAIGSALGTARFLRGSSASGIPILGATGGLIGAGLSKLTEDTTYFCATDVQVIEKTKENVTQTITDNTSSGNGQGSVAMGLIGALLGQKPSSGLPNAGATQQQVMEVKQGKQRQHQTRLVAQAQKMWLDLDAATLTMAGNLEKSITNLFP